MAQIPCAALTVHKPERAVLTITATKDQQTIGEIVVIGNKTFSRNVIISLSGHKVGDPCDTATLTDMRDKLVKSGYFGMHYPNQADPWVRIRAQDVGNNTCKITITVDENDKITSVTISGSGPIKTGEIMSLIGRTATYNSADFDRDMRKIADLYSGRGYSMVFGKGLGMDPNQPGVLNIPIIVDRIGKIEVRKDGVKQTDTRVLRQLTVKAGDYLNRRTLYEVGRQKLLGTGRYEEVNIVEHTSPSHVVDIDLVLTMKSRGKH